MSSQRPHLVSESRTVYLPYMKYIDFFKMPHFVLGIIGLPQGISCHISACLL